MDVIQNGINYMLFYYWIERVSLGLNGPYYTLIIEEDYWHSGPNKALLQCEWWGVGRRIMLQSGCRSFPVLGFQKMMGCCWNTKLQCQYPFIVFWRRWWREVQQVVRKRFEGLSSFFFHGFFPLDHGILIFGFGKFARLVNGFLVAFLKIQQNSLEFLSTIPYKATTYFSKKNCDNIFSMTPHWWSANCEAL